MNKLLPKILGALVLLLILIQFVRLPRNTSSAPAGPDDFLVKYSVPAPFRQQIQTSCYDCHSNHTHYPWYANIQPVGWWLQHHVDEGKRELNFSEFGSFTPKRQVHKLDETVKELTKQDMPLASYTLTHPEAKLSAQDSQAMADWFRQLHAALASQYGQGS